MAKFLKIFNRIATRSTTVRALLSSFFPFLVSFVNSGQLL